MAFQISFIFVFVEYMFPHLEHWFLWDDASRVVHMWFFICVLPFFDSKLLNEFSLGSFLNCLQETGYC